MEVCRVLEEKGYGGKREMLKELCGVLYMGEELCSDVGSGLYNERLKECKSELEGVMVGKEVEVSARLEGGKLEEVSARSEVVGPKLEEVSAKLEEVSARLEVVGPKLEVVGPKINIVLPWCGEKLSGKCSALKLNSGLHTQCMKNVNENYCNGCSNLIEKNGGIAPYGTVEDRLKCGILEYVDPKGKQTIPYANVMKKMNITQEEALHEAAKLGWVIPPCHFEKKVSKRGRPKRDTSAEDTESDEGNETKKRGRPKKEKEIVSTS